MAASIPANFAASTSGNMQAGVLVTYEVEKGNQKKMKGLLLFSGNISFRTGWDGGWGCDEMKLQAWEGGNLNVVLC